MSYASSCLYPSNINAKILQSENILNSDTITTSKLVVTEPLEIDNLTLKTLVVEETTVIGNITEAKAPLTIGLDVNGTSVFCYGNIATQSTIAAEQVETNQLNIGSIDTTTTSFVSNASIDSDGNLTNTSIISTGNITGDTLQGNNGISGTSLNIGSIDTDTSAITSNMSIDSTGLVRTEGMLKSTAQIGFQSGFVGDDSSWTTKVEIGYNSSSQGYVNADLLTGDLTGSVTGGLTGSVTGDLTGGALSTAKTQASSDSSTLLATTEFVSNAISDTYVPVVFSGRSNIVDNKVDSESVWGRIYFANGGFDSSISPDNIAVVASAYETEPSVALISFSFMNITNTSFDILGLWMDSRENETGRGYYYEGFSFVATAANS